MDEETPLLHGKEQPEEFQSVVDDSDITLSRRLARYLSRYSWYCPPAGEKRAPTSIDKAWEYFELVTLARYQIQEPSESGTLDDHFHKADVGEKEKPTRLYPVLSTPETDLADFGVGVGIYFFTLRALAIIMFIAGLINIPNLMFYASDNYEHGRGQVSRFWTLETSAICTHQEWVACPTCTRDQWDTFPSTFNRYAEVESDDGTILSFVKKNSCTVNGKVGLVGYLSLIFITVSIAVLQRFIKWRERHLDLSAQTSTDYSIEVENPPEDAHDVDEWKKFFEQFGHVTCLTVALDNEELIRALISRRQLVRALDNLQPPNVEVDPHNVAKAVENVPEMAWYKKLIWGDAKAIQEQIAKLDELIETDYSKRKWPVSEVFVTFEVEVTQTVAMKALRIRGIDVVKKNKSALERESYVFRGEHLLSITEPPEPQSVRWQDLDEDFPTRVKQQLVTGLLTVLTILAGCFLITYTRFKYGSVYAAIMVTAVNSAAPMLCSYMTEYESHPSEGSKQASLYYKVTACIWIFTAIITAIITPFVDTLENEDSSLIPAMFAIFITEMLKAPVTQVLDIPGHLKRHLIAPRATDQRRMYSYFEGTAYQLSERYTDMTNVLFLTFYYALLLPAGFFYGSATLAVHYWADKFCLLRNWAQAPPLNTKVADLSRDYFFTGAVAAYAIISAYNYASFPYDNTCEGESTVSSDYVGTFKGVDGDGNPFETTISSGEKNYFYCYQDIIRFWPPAYLEVLESKREGADWMSKEQYAVSWVYGWTSFGVCVALVIILIDIYRRKIKAMLFTGFEGDQRKAFFDKRETVVHDNFSQIPSISAYVPQAKISGYSYPVLLCDVSGMDPELIGWDSPEDSYDSFNAIFDVPGLAEKEGMFSIVKYWPVIEQEAEEEEEEIQRGLEESLETEDVAEDEQQQGFFGGLMKWAYN